VRRCTRVLARFAAEELHACLLTVVVTASAVRVHSSAGCRALGGFRTTSGKGFLACRRSRLGVEPWGSVLAAVFAAGLRSLVATARNVLSPASYAHGVSVCISMGGGGGGSGARHCFVACAPPHSRRLRFINARKRWVRRSIPRYAILPVLSDSDIGSWLPPLRPRGNVLAAADLVCRERSPARFSCR